jgi:hypothetical protein
MWLTGEFRDTYPFPMLSKFSIIRTQAIAYIVTAGEQFLFRSPAVSESSGIYMTPDG